METICFDILRGGHSLEVTLWPKNRTDLNDFFSWLYDLDYDFYDAQYSQCEQCNAWEHVDCTTWAHDETYCESCATEYLTYCEGCEEYHDTRHRDTHVVYQIRGGRRVEHGRYCTESISDNNFFYCDSCNEYFTDDHANYCEDSDQYYCDICHEENEESREKYIHDYSYKPTPIFFGNDGLAMGIELEVEFDDNTQDAAENIKYKFDDSRYYMKRDGSLDNGIEFVTHPLTYSHHVNVIDKLIDAIKAADSCAKSHNASTCGLHIHVGRDKLKQGAENRLAMFFTYCSSELEIFGRRKNNSYAKFNKEFKREFYKAKKDFKELGRYSALNLNVNKTIEFRFFKGTLKKETLKASIEFTEILINFINDKHSLGSKPSQYWLKFMKKVEKKGSENLKEYLKSRHLIAA